MSARSGFQYDGEGFTVVYIDGSCENNGFSNAKAGYGVYFGPGNPLNRASPISGRHATSNTAEIQAATAAIKLAKQAGIQHLCIRTDSDFLLNSVLRWMPGWKNNGWRKSDGNLVENRDDFIALDAAMNSGYIQLKWEKVQAHSGDYGNDQADRLAKEGAAMYRP